ncbi:MAG: DUF4097 domain-containing protein [Bryobacteraceae bacterium]|nr:DUF4097 domain-containing protein [Bryobacteraceae bacterium]
MRLTLLALPLLLTSCDFEGLQNDRFREDFHMTYKLEPGQRVSVENANGGIEVAGWDKNEVDVSGQRFAPTEDILKQIRVDVQASAIAVRVRTIMPKGMGWRGVTGGVKYLIRVPKQTLLDRVESTNGSLRVEEVQGNAQLRTTNGSVKLYRAQGAFDVHTTNGSIELSSHGGDVKAHTTNGGIRVEGLDGGLTAGTTNGSINARLLGASTQPVRMDTTNGAIDITLEKPAAGLHASTSNGSITVKAPASLKASIRASSGSAVNSDFSVDGEVEKKRVRGTINGGGPLYELETNNGRIRLERL